MGTVMGGVTGRNEKIAHGTVADEPSQADAAKAKLISEKAPSPPNS